MTKSMLSLLVALFFAAGCSAPNAFSGKEYEEARSREALPYVLQITGIERRVIKANSGGGGGQAEGETAADVEAGAENSGQDEAVAILGAEPFLLTVPTQEAAVLQKIKEGLDEYNVFAKVIYNEAELTQLGIKPDLKLTINIVHRAGVDESAFDHKTNGYIWTNLGLWLLAGLPGWIIDDTAVNPGVTEISYKLERVLGDDNAKVIYLDKAVGLEEVNDLNFLRRASWIEYLTQIVVPPFLVGSDPDSANAALYENYISRLQSEISRGIKSDLLADIRKENLTQVLVSKADSENLEILIFANRDVPRIKVDYISADGKKLEVLGLTQPENTTDWQSAASRLLPKTQFLDSYSRKLIVKKPKALDRFKEGGLLRITVLYSQTEEDTWTTRFGE